MHFKRTPLTTQAIERLKQFAICEEWRTYHGYDGRCPCAWPHCDNKGVVLPKPMGLEYIAKYWSV